MKARKILTMVAALALTAALAIGGTLAYLTAKTETATNTFTVGNVGSLALKETNPSNNEVVDVSSSAATLSYQIVPGVDITKDPKVTYTQPTTPVDVYVYVTIEAKTAWEYDAANHKYAVQNTADQDQLSWTVNTTDWTYLKTENGVQVYYKALAKDATFTDVSVIANNTITVSGTTIDQDNISTVADNAGDIVFKSYAIQQAHFESDPSGAWTALNAQLNPAA